MYTFKYPHSRIHIYPLYELCTSECFYFRVPTPPNIHKNISDYPHSRVFISQNTHILIPHHRLSASLNVHTKILIPPISTIPVIDLIQGKLNILIHKYWYHRISTPLNVHITEYLHYLESTSLAIHTTEYRGIRTIINSHTTAHLQISAWPISIHTTVHPLYRAPTLKGIHTFEFLHLPLKKYPLFPQTNNHMIGYPLY